MMPILGFMKCFAQFQKLCLTASNLSAMRLAGCLELLIRLRPINAQHCMNFFLKVAKIARKRPFTSLSIIINKKNNLYTYYMMKHMNSQ